MEDFVCGLVLVQFHGHRPVCQLAVEKRHEDDLVTHLHMSDEHIDGPGHDVVPNTLVYVEQIFGNPSSEKEGGSCVPEEDNPATV